MKRQGAAEAVPNELRRARRGALTLELTASALVSLAVNTVQNGWTYRDLALLHSDCQRYESRLPTDVRVNWAHEVLVQVYTETLKANRDSAAPSWLAGAG